ncbi:hypothetical protein DFS33DRAFT_1269005 [Desarmillaria ectypa]|nr:hypothetical protein DFS33DRAFT_1269005 [Desarmillaria ectypa]
MLSHWISQAVAQDSSRIYLLEESKGWPLVLKESLSYHQRMCSEVVESVVDWYCWKLVVSYSDMFRISAIFLSSGSLDLALPGLIQLICRIKEMKKQIKIMVPSVVLMLMLFGPNEEELRTLVKL